MPTVRRGLCGVACALGILVVATTAVAFDREISCLRGDITGSSRDLAPLGLTPAPRSVAERLARLERALGIRDQIPVFDFPGGGIGSASPPCPGSGRGTGIVITDVASLQATDRTRPSTPDVVLSHELAHVLQFSADPAFVRSLCTHTLGEVKSYELLADFGAGYAMFKLGETQAHQDFLLTIVSLADYEFTNVSHHGTVTERLNAFDMGQASGYFGRPLDMAALMRNRAVFLRVLGGANLTSVESNPRAYADYARHALAEIYQ